jgi:hypothetical protein
MFEKPKIFMELYMQVAEAIGDIRETLKQLQIDVNLLSGCLHVIHGGRRRTLTSGLASGGARGCNLPVMIRRRNASRSIHY